MKKLILLIGHIAVLIIGVVSTVLGFLRHNELELFFGGLDIGVGIINILWWFEHIK